LVQDRVVLLDGAGIFSSSPMAMWTSKLGNKYPKAQVQENDQASQRELKRLRGLSSRGNNLCADCGASDSSWSSVSIGVFICVTCSDVHRSVGTHITKVKGCTGTYLWGPDELEQMRTVGNDGAEKIYGNAKIEPTASKEKKQQFVVNKYEKRMFAGNQSSTTEHKAPLREGEAAESTLDLLTGLTDVRSTPHPERASNRFEPLPFLHRSVTRQSATSLETLSPQSCSQRAKMPQAGRQVSVPDSVFDELFNELEADTVHHKSPLYIASDNGLDAFLNTALHASSAQPAPKADPLFDLEWPVC